MRICKIPVAVKFPKLIILTFFKHTVIESYGVGTSRDLSRGFLAHGFVKFKYVKIKFNYTLNNLEIFLYHNKLNDI
jgi:hypothetical protein